MYVHVCSIIVLIHIPCTILLTTSETLRSAPLHNSNLTSIE